MKLRLAAIAVALLFSVGTASAATIQTFSSGTVNLAITDNSTTTSTITLPGIANPDSVTDLTVTVAIDHTWVGDLEITLTAPDTTSLSLLLVQPGDPGDSGASVGDSSDLSSAYAISFNDLFTAVAEDMGSGCGSVDTIGLTAGCTDDEYAPHTPLSAVYGNFAGDWVLSVTDTATGDTGTLVEWSLTAEYEGAVVPEPSAAVVFGLGFALVASRSRRGRIE